MNNTLLSFADGQVYDGLSPTSALLLTTSGTNIPRPVESSSNEMLVKFTSDDFINVAQGFEATYSAI